jgi:hypothetical protein
MIYSYQKHIIPGPNGTVISFNQIINPETQESISRELGSIDNTSYVFVPDDIILEDQPEEINLQQVNLTPEKREELKTNLRPFQIIAEEQQRMIRDKYTQEDEMYFARIGIGVSLGLYEFQPGEQTELEAFGLFVEYVREWGRQKRAELGL